MDRLDLQDLLGKYRLGTCSEEERALVESWYLVEAEKEGDPVSTESLTRSNMRIAGLIQQHTGKSVVRIAPKRVRLWPRVAAAVAIFIFLGSGSYLILEKYKTQKKQPVAIVQDIKPGTNSATLTLGNGKTILLNQAVNGQVAMEGGMAIVKTAEGQVQYQPHAGHDDQVFFNTVTTRRKEQYQVVLADGTKAWLNAASSIRYPSAFDGADRVVSITGEVYFEVAPHPDQPFKVTAGVQTIEVLGTSFNVNTYEDEPVIKTTLLDGAIRVSASNQVNTIKPGQQVIFQGNRFIVGDADTEEAVAWKNGYFRFNGEKIETIMRKLSRWYDIDVEFEGPVPDDEFSGTISRFTNISEVLHALSYYQTVHFNIAGRRVVVSK